MCTPHNSHGGRKPNRKPVTGQVFEASEHGAGLTKTGFHETGLIETGLSKPIETGFNRLETGLVWLAKPVLAPSWLQVRPCTAENHFPRAR